MEEAAEVFEAHALCTMNKNTKHVILIGDHKQLRPKPATYEIGRHYNLDISLFERMIQFKKNEKNQLECQHRMRPEISKLITPSIYKTLYNSESVFKYPNVKGLVKNVYFIDHQHQESHTPRNEESWQNVHEAQFLAAFANHLLKQGYLPEEITILSTYSAQVFTITEVCEIII